MPRAAATAPSPGAELVSAWSAAAAGCTFEQLPRGARLAPLLAEAAV